MSNTGFLKLQGKVLRFNDSHLKIIALASMAIDHIGYFFLPDIAALRIIGRLAFPLFAYGVVQGERYSRKLIASMQRLAMFAMISQPIYFIFANPDAFNIGLELLLGLLVLMADKFRWYQKYFVWICAGIATVTFNADYGLYGLLAIYLLSRKSYSLDWWIPWSALHLTSFWMVNWFQPFAVFTPLLIQLSNGKKGNFKSGFMYLFYPLHLLVYSLVHAFIM